MDNLDRFIPVLLGFNPASCARKLPIENWTKTFSDIVMRLENAVTRGKGFILNPIVGPEPITGSTRMKAGTATKIILETIFSLALSPVTGKSVQSSDLTQHIKRYQSTCDAVYKEMNSLCKLVDLGNNSLQSGGRICYVSSDASGVMCLIDASECPPTFGAAKNEVRGFLEGGFSRLHNKEGDISEKFQISAAFFRDALLPLLTEKDFVVLFNSGDMIDIPTTSAHVFSVHFDSPAKKTSAEKQQYNVDLNINLPDCRGGSPDYDKFQQQLQKEIATKWLCNCLTTGAYSLGGKVFRNYMVDVRVRNNKLFHRAAGIIETFCNCSTEEAFDLLIKSIYQTDTVPKSCHTLPLSVHIEKAAPMDKVVPVALVLGLAHCSVVTAQTILRETPVVRTAIAKFSK